MFVYFDIKFCHIRHEKMRQSAFCNLWFSTIKVLKFLVYYSDIWSVSIVLSASASASASARTLLAEPAVYSKSKSPDITDLKNVVNCQPYTVPDLSEMVSPLLRVLALTFDNMYVWQWLGLRTLHTFGDNKVRLELWSNDSKTTLGTLHTLLSNRSTCVA